MAKSKIKLSESEVSQTVDLKELFGPSLEGNEGLAQTIAQAMIDKIIERTESGKDINGKAFKPYSKMYKDSLEYESFGKTSDVNLKLTGQMLGTLDVLETNESKVTIGWNDGTESAKAYNHNVGDTVPKRQFFGLTDAELESIRREFVAQVEVRTQLSLSERESLVIDIIRALNNDQLGIEVDVG